MVIQTGPAQEVSDSKNVSKWPTDHSCDTLEVVGEVVGFCSCPKTLMEAKLKMFAINAIDRGDFKTA